MHVPTYIFKTHLLMHVCIHICQETSGCDKQLPQKRFLDTISVGIPNLSAMLILLLTKGWRKSEAIYPTVYCHIHSEGLHTVQFPLFAWQKPSFIALGYLGLALFWARIELKLQKSLSLQQFCNQPNTTLHLAFRKRMQSHKWHQNSF